MMIIKDKGKTLIKFPQIQKEDISQYPQTKNVLIEVFLEKILNKLSHNLTNTMLSEEIQSFKTKRIYLFNLLWHKGVRLSHLIYNLQTAKTNQYSSGHISSYIKITNTRSAITLSRICHLCKLHFIHGSVQ